MNLTKRISSIVLALLLMATFVLPGVSPRAAAGLDNTVISLLVNNLQYYLPFDGNCADVSTGKETAENDVTYVAGKFGQAAQFTQSSSYVKLTDLTEYPADYSFSINLWIKDNQTGGDPGIFGNKNWSSGSNPGFIFSTRTGNIRLSITDSTQSVGQTKIDTTTTIADGTWHMFSASVDRVNGALNMYIDGVNVGSGDLTAYAGQAFTALSTMIGNDGTGSYPDAAPNEDIDDFMLFNKALSEAEVQALYGAGDAMPRMYYSDASLALENGESSTPILIKKDNTGVTGAAFSGVTYVSADPNVATVDSTGKITPVMDSGTTTVTASGAWGISAYGLSFPLSTTIHVTAGTVVSDDPVQTYSSQAIYGTPTIDGIMDSAWDNCPSFDIFKSSSPITAVGRLMWDTDNLYVLVDVSDDTPYALSPEPELGAVSGIGVKNDSVDIWVNWNDRDSVTYYSYDATHFLIDRNNAIGTSFPEWSDVTSVTHAVVADEDHYVVEVAIPLSSVVDLDNWPQFGFNISVNDDADGDDVRNTYITWLTSGASYWSSPSGLLPVDVVENYVVQPAAITTDRLWDGTVGYEYEQLLAATGTDILWSIAGGALPSGLKLSSTGTISGKPTTSGTYTFTIKAANSVSEDTKEMSIVINSIGEQPDAASGKVVFGTFADTHSGGNLNMDQRLAKALQYFSSQGANAAVCVGDLTNKGLQAQYDEWASVVDANKGDVEIIACMGNHENGTASLFTNATGDKPNADYVINGYHFITLSPGSGTFDPDTGLGTSMGGGDFSYVRDWLEERLATDAAEDPTKPIMVFFHQPMYGTHYVSDEWSGSGLSTGSGDTFQSVFDDYPQAVCFSAHIHTPNNDPLSIWQDGGFTTVNVSTTYYLEMESGMICGTTPDDNNDVAQVSLIELDGSKVTITNRDLLADQDISVWTFDVTKPEEFPYTDARAEAAEAPVFRDSAGIRVSEIADTTALINFDQAVMEPNDVGDIVHSYRYDFVNTATGNVDLTFKTWAEYYILPTPATITQAASDLTAGTQYELRIHAIDAYGKISDDYISKTFITTLDGKSLYAVTFDSRGGGGVNQQIVTSGATITRPADPTRSGYEFKGWYADAARTTAWDFTTPVTADTKLYAGWTQKSDSSDPGDTGGSSDPTDGSNNHNADVTSKTAGDTTTTSGEVAGTADASGKLSGSLDEDMANALVKGAKDAESSGHNAVVKMTLGGSNSAASAEVTIPRSAFGQLADETNAALSVETGLGTVTFDAEAVSAINGASASGDISIGIAAADTSNLSAEAKNKIGGRPVYDFTVSAGGMQISGFGGGSADISLPYTPAAGEDLNAVVVYYVSDSGELQTVRGKYDPATGTVRFTAAHFSGYAVGYNKVTFSDVVSTDWYYNPVTFIAARGITTGTGAGTFNPNDTLSRGQFIVMLMRAYGIEADTNPTDNFSDAGSTYYTGYLAAARRLGISNGVGDNNFAPDSEITRQDMFTLLYRALGVLNELPEAAGSKTTVDFGDAGEISSYAQDAMNTLVKAGIISGNGGKLNPTGTTTRAEMAQVLYNLLSL